MRLTVAFLSLLALLLGGCLVAKLENTARLMRHPEFEGAARDYPGFTSQSLKTITALEERIESDQ
jgi:hypothetical protein